jgi:hypothetical protein
MYPTILLIAFGKKYIDILLEDYKLIPKSYNLVIYTNDTNTVKTKLPSADVREYEESIFKYFDKISLTYKLTEEKNKSILYIDVGRLKEVPNLIWKIDLDTVSNIHYIGNWGSIKSANDLVNHKSEYFEDTYWDNILSIFKSKYDLNLIPTILERVFILPYNKKMKKFISVFEKLRPLFEHTSVSKRNVYKGIGNGEGLAMGYSILDSESSIVHFYQSTNIKNQLI